MIQVRDRRIGSGHPTLVIAEMASTHEGKTDRALGTGHIAPFSDPEQAYRERMKKHLVAARRIEAGEVLAPDMVSLMRVDSGLLASAYEQALGCVARRSLEAYEPINLADIRQHDET